MSTQEVPWDWAQLMIGRDAVTRDGAANISELARRCQLAVETVRRAIHGIGTPSPRTVDALVRVLGPEVQELLGVRVDLGEYVPPKESLYLDTDQRKALDQLIRVMARPTSEPRPEVDMSTDVPDLRVAARKGHSAGRAARAAQDAAGEETQGNGGDGEG